MQRAIKTVTPAAKLELVESWRASYSPVVFDELLRVARDPEAKRRIANWNLDQFDEERITNAHKRRTDAANTSPTIPTVARRPFKKKRSEEHTSELQSH